MKSVDFSFSEANGSEVTRVKAFSAVQLTWFFYGAFSNMVSEFEHWGVLNIAIEGPVSTVEGKEANV